MNILNKLAVLSLVGGTLTACGGTSIGDRAVAQAERFDALALRNANMTSSGPRVVDETTGRANFSGAAAIIEGNQFDFSVLVGDVDMQINFDRANAVSGDITNITGAANLSDFDPTVGEFDSYSGGIDLTGGSVGSGNALSID